MSLSEHVFDELSSRVRPAPADALAHGVLDFSRALLARLPEGRHPFAPSVPVAEQAPALDRLVALLGREPGRQMGGRSS